MDMWLPFVLQCCIHAYMRFLKGTRKQNFMGSKQNMITGNKMLGTITMLAAPFLFFQMYTGQKAGVYNTSLGGLFDLFYMAGWLCSIYGLYRLQALGTKRDGMVLFAVQVTLLCVANVWNVWVIIDPANESTLFYVLDMFWPLSNVCMLVLGIVAAMKGVLKGWTRYAPLLCGLWLPVVMLANTIAGQTPVTFALAASYSTIAWAVLGLAIYKSSAVVREPALPAPASI
jgi:hypothetical protein